jgi:dihydroorotase
MLVDKEQSLRCLFGGTALPIMAHCEDTATINANMAAAKTQYGDDPDVKYHPTIRSAEACYASTAFAVKLATEYGARLHVAHLTTVRELELFGQNPNITAEAVVAHLFFTDADYATLGTRIKCNPAIKTSADREALRRALTDGRITTIGTDHAPHQLSDKEGGCCRAASGMPMLQFSLPTMLELVDARVLTIERMVQLMSHNPATLFSVRQRGFLRPGYKADIAIVRRDTPWRVTKDVIQSKCKWSPMEGHEYAWHVELTMCNGNVVFQNGQFCADSRGEEVAFR